MSDQEADHRQYQEREKGGDTKREKKFFSGGKPPEYDNQVSKVRQAIARIFSSFTTEQR
jgi:hypothetical protein